jgi:hypothetical protein
MGKSGVERMVELQGLLGRNYIGRVQRQGEGVAAI